MPEHLDAGERAALVDFWQRRADGEWTTARSLAHVREDLVSLGAPCTLVDLVDSSIEDEHRHTAWCREMAVRLGGTEARTARVLGERPLSFEGLGERENQIVRAVFAGCISETIALHVLRESHAALGPKWIRAVNRQHMAEEVRHAQVGWAFLAWLSEMASLRVEGQRVIERALPSLIELARSSWTEGARETRAELATLGLLHLGHVERGISRALSEVICPGFERYGVEVPPGLG